MSCALFSSLTYGHPISPFSFPLEFRWALEEVILCRILWADIFCSKSTETTVYRNFRFYNFTNQKSGILRLFFSFSWKFLDFVSTARIFSFFRSYLEPLSRKKCRKAWSSWGSSSFQRNGGLITEVLHCAIKLALWTLLSKSPASLLSPINYNAFTNISPPFS